MKQLVKRLLGLPLLALGLLLPVSCDDDAPAPATNQPKEINTYNVAVIMPGGNGNTQWKQMADWALLNMERAQEGRESQVRLKVEWYDESTEDLQALGAKLAARSDLSAIVGPYESDHVRTLGSWNWQCRQYDEWGSYTADIQYEPLKERYALLVAASEGWTNYRHQADVLNMYHLLKARGYNDDHIVLIVADDLAQNAENPVPGEVKTAADGPNLYEGIRIDYRLADLQPADIGRILNGERSERLPHVIGATTADNVLVFWSGHGLPGYFCWGAERHGFSTDDFTTLMHDMSEGKKFRKLLWVAETCYSASVLKGYDQTPSVLCLAAANENEPSHADVYDLQLHAFRSNRFTLTLTSAIKETPDITLNQLFYRVTRQTTGSHVKMFGEETFDNLNLATAKEFF